MTLLTLGDLDPGDPEVNSETFAGEELRQRTDSYEDSNKFDIVNFGDLGGQRRRRHGREVLEREQRRNLLFSVSFLAIVLPQFSCLKATVAWCLAAIVES